MLLICKLKFYYLANAWPSFGHKSHNHRLFAACNKAKSHRRTTVENNFSGLRRRYVAVTLRSLICCRFIQVTENGIRSNSISIMLSLL